MDRPIDKLHIPNLGPNKAISAKEAEQGSLDSPGVTLPKNQDKNQNTYRTPIRAPQRALGTNHLDPLLKEIQDLIPALDHFLLVSGLEVTPIPHQRSLERNCRSLYRKSQRVARVAGRLYSAQGWDLKYVHAANTEVGRKLKARGGYDALRAEHLRQEGNLQ